MRNRVNEKILRNSPRSGRRAERYARMCDEVYASRRASAMRTEKLN